ncbi:hypothetical protein [Actinoplanes aureus]|uniref:Uncharacterized protein n=1 Tax=Actinoplanes aureus TaxID=2792083 RepID=A0A931G116_9ACTN|nr:hypothetical protein [Actinoplanes aureus]MBG0564661.1 hypothetical protein [Actinoplanes aureus]
MTGSRNWTDSTTNDIFYDGLDAAGYLRWLGDRSLGDQHLLPQFLHEFTHHWCFQSLVGSTLALAELRLTTLTAAYPDGRSIWARDLLGHRYLSHLMRPLGEGMAQLAEFDLRPMGDEFHPATPLGVASLCFSVTHDHIFRSTMMQFLRNSPAVLERKASLYLRPFEVNDGYLPGYMAVKNLAFSMIGRGDNVPLEMFLTYLRSYFWDDPAYTKILFSGELDGAKVAAAISQRFRERMFTLFTATDVPERIRSFWASWQPHDPMLCADELDVVPADYAEAYEQLGLFERHYLQLLRHDPEAVETATGLSATALADLLPDLAVTRRFAPIATTEVEVSGNGDVVMGIPLPPGRHRLRVFTPTTGSVLALTAEDAEGEVRLLRVWHLGPDAEVDEETLLHYPRCVTSLSEVMPRLRERFVAGGLPVVDSPALEDFTKGIYDDALDLYTIAAAARIPGHDRMTAARSMLRATGLREIFRNDVTAIRLVAAMSLIGDRLELIRPDLAGFTYGLISLAQSYFLPDEDHASLQHRLDRIVARDPDALVLKAIEDDLVIFV